MSIITYIDNNPFGEGMVFNSFSKIAEFLNLDGGYYSDEGKKVLNHYCEWHKGENESIIIDRVFDKVKPFITKGFRYDIGQEIKTKQGKIVILDRYIAPDAQRNNSERNSNACYYKCKCCIDGYEFDLQESRINSGAGCPLCAKNVVIPGIYSLGDVFPGVIPYLKDPEDAYRFTPYSQKRVWCKCPNCGDEKQVIVSYLAQHGFKCTVCSDNISYPNKFVREVLNQLNVKYKPEKSFGWSDGKIYDQYLYDYNMIIENHGLQHYMEIEGSVFGTLEEQQNNDKYKLYLATKNNIGHYIVLDCRESSKEWIKKSIMESHLPKILLFEESDVDWDKCDLNARSNAEIKKICEEYKNDKNLSSLGEKFNHQVNLISKYLEIGAKCGFCDYAKGDPAKNGYANKGQSKSKPIYCITDDIYFMSMRICENYYKLHGIDNFDGEKIGKYIKNNKPYKGKLFQRISRVEFNQKYDESLENKSINIQGDRFLDRYIKEE